MSRKKYQYNEKTFGDRLRKFRILRGYDLVVFLKLLDISQGSLSAYENNKTLISSKAIINLKQNTDININWFLTGEGQMIGQGTECDTCIYNKVENFEHRVAELKGKYNSKNLELLKMAGVVLESGTEFSNSLAANIRSFFHSVQIEKRLSDVESELFVVKEKIKRCPTGSEESGVK